MQHGRRFDPINYRVPYGDAGLGVFSDFVKCTGRGKVFCRHLFLFVLFVAELLIVVASAVHADDFETLYGDAPDIPWHVTAYDGINIDNDAGEVVARGDVLVEKEDLRLRADTVRLYPGTRTAFAEGNVRVTAGEDTFSGNRLELNWEKETGTFYEGTFFFKKNNFHVQADKFEKTGTSTYLAEDVLITTCDGESPAWLIGGKKLDITVGGYGVVNHALFNVKNVPVFYSPFLTFPVKLTRQSGLLSPRFGTSERKGFLFSQPFFWAINDSSDATLYTDYMSKRGEKLGAEYRYFLSNDDKGVAMFDFLEDRKVDNGSGTSSADYGYDDDRYLRPNADRYWFRMKHDQVLGKQSGLTLDLDMVSDQDYLYDFKNGYSGYLDSRRAFNDVFSREIDDYNDPVRKNRLNFSTQWVGYTLNAEALWWDDVVARRRGDPDDTVQSLPAVYFDRYRQPLFGSRLYAAFETQAAYFYSHDGAKGGRLDLYPRIYYPFRFGRILSVEPSIGGRQTLWQVDSFGDGDEERDRTQHRELYDVSLDLSSEIYTLFTPDWGDIDGVKHAAKFQVGFDYVPTQNQAAYPYFDVVDRIDGKNLITYSVVNSLTTRTGDKDARDYHQVMRFELSQSFDINREQEGDPEPFYPISGDLQLDLGNWCYLQGDAAWSVYSGEFTSRNVAYGFSDERGDRLYLQHRYVEDLRESISASVSLKLTDNLWLFSDYERNLKDGREIGSSLEALYRGNCWSLEVQYQNEDDDTSLGFVVTLYGLGGMGGGSKHSEGLPPWAEDGF